MSCNAVCQAGLDPTAGHGVQKLNSKAALLLELMEQNTIDKSQECPI